jgi:hypothetical protein
MNWRHEINIHKVLREADEKYDLDFVEEDCPEEVKEALALEVAKAAPLVRFASSFRKAKSIA